MWLFGSLDPKKIEGERQAELPFYELCCYLGLITNMQFTRYAGLEIQ